MVNIAVLEDDLYLQRRFARVLKGWDHVQQVFTCSDNAEFLACLENHHIDILLADLDLPDGRGNQSIKGFQPQSIQRSQLLFHHQWIVRLFCKRLLMALLAIFTRAMNRLKSLQLSKQQWLEIHLSRHRLPIRLSPPFRIMITTRRLLAFSEIRRATRPKVKPSQNKKAKILSSRELEVLNLISWAFLF